MLKNASGDTPYCTSESPIIWVNDASNLAIGYHFTASPTAVFGILLNFSKLPTSYQHITDPSVCPLPTLSPIPQRRTYSPGLVDTVHQNRRRPRVARRTVGGRRRLEGCIPRDRGLGFARVTSISPRTNATPLSYIPQPCNGPNGTKGLHSNKSNQAINGL